MNIYYGKDFTRDLKKLKKAHPKKCNQVLKKIELFSQNPEYPSLRLHKLKGDLKEYFSITVGANLRIIFSWVDEDTVTFFRMGTHNEVYESN